MNMNRIFGISGLFNAPSAQNIWLQETQRRKQLRQTQPQLGQQAWPMFMGPLIGAATPSTIVQDTTTIKYLNYQNGNIDVIMDYEYKPDTLVVQLIFPDFSIIEEREIKNPIGLSSLAYIGSTDSEAIMESRLMGFDKSSICNKMEYNWHIETERRWGR